jgi:PKD repeat protein
MMYLRYNKIFLVLAFLIFQLSMHCQKEASWWFFGSKACLHFHSNSVTAHPGLSSIIGQHAFSGISDTSGNLLFYLREGDLVYNKLHDTMANGFNIGGFHSPQASIVIPKGGSQYYIITHNMTNYFSPGIPSMFAYSIVDLTLASGNGSVIVTNQSITPAGMPFVSKMAGTKHCNGADYWLLVHKGGNAPGNNEFYAYQVSNSGISNSPVISNIGTLQPQRYNNFNFFFGKVRFSPNGKKVCTVYPNRTIELYDFNNNNGTLSNRLKIDSTTAPSASFAPYAYDIEFSPDGSKLYVTYVSNGPTQTHPLLCQFDLTSGSASTIASSKTVIDTSSIFSLLSLQLGLDGKIYMSKLNQNHLSIINSPNITGTNCSYVSLGISLGTIPSTTVFAASNTGLPSFVSNYFESKPTFPSFSYTAGCGLVSFYSPTITAFPITGYSVSSYQWNFNDPLSGSANTSTLTNPSHAFSANGTYNVHLVLNYFCGSDTIKQTITVSGLPNLAVSGKTVMCKGETQSLTFSGATTYSMNGLAIPQASATIQASANTVYTITGFDSSSGCKAVKSFSVTVKPCTAVSQFFENDVLKIYPNPYENELNIEVKEVYHALFFDFTGKSIKEQELHIGKNTLSVQDNSKGIYFLRLVNEHTSSTVKVVKE